MDIPFLRFLTHSNFCNTKSCLNTDNVVGRYHYPHTAVSLVEYWPSLIPGVALSATNIGSPWRKRSWTAYLALSKTEPAVVVILLPLYSGWRAVPVVNFSLYNNKSGAVEQDFKLPQVIIECAWRSSDEVDQLIQCELLKWRTNNSLWTGFFCWRFGFNNPDLQWLRPPLSHR